jgi:hypothetical protein
VTITDEIRYALALHRGADYVAAEGRDQERAALDRVLEECDRCERGGTMMAPSIVRSLIAAALGVTEDVPDRAGEEGGRQ